MSVVLLEIMMSVEVGGVLTCGGGQHYQSQRGDVVTHFGLRLLEFVSVWKGEVVVID